MAVDRLPPLPYGRGLFFRGRNPSSPRLTQDQFAAVAGLNKTHYSRLETVEQSMTPRTMKIISDALEVRIRDLVWEV